MSSLSLEDVKNSDAAMMERTDSFDTASPTLADLRLYLGRPETTSTTSSLFDKTAMAVPVAAIKALLGVVQRSQAETMMGLQDELAQATHEIMTQSFGRRRSQIALKSGCELFLKYITRTFLELPDFNECRKQVLERGERFHIISLAARDRIVLQAQEFVKGTILTHGWSRVVAAILLEASRTKQFDLIVLEGRPDLSGAKAAASYAQETKIPVKIITDAAMAYVMEKVDMVLVGAEGVLENGGVVNKIGTYALATVAKAAGKPFYVAAESYKFARLYPLSQSDVPQNMTDNAPLEFLTGKDTKIELPENIEVVNPATDFTPSNYITLLFTDLGVLTPSAVSDELIRLYQ
jgi:translation initiation factor eIF-2B subunit alpha